ncbi:hypothetical protein WN55_00301 [Dufourea novaeangliae]|uniref:Tc3 transposase DNA binding domain-containing protein n=1 Tax=Dufourea novaeangliae TaxID=178035 RepID=A0A154PAS2_DUFNO|nr:hypothetical protein WN55_00301 [Dufourea novaeangliae]
MDRGKFLNQSKIDRILLLRREKYSIAKIAKLVNRSRKVVSDLLKTPTQYGKKKSRGRPRIITNREKRAILRIASNFNGTAR